jgi:hypothetical protein
MDESPRGCDVEQPEEAPRSIHCIISNIVRDGDSRAPRTIHCHILDIVRDGGFWGASAG